MKKIITLLLINFITIIGFSQEKICHENCNITWEQIRNYRNPLWTRVDITNECAERIRDKRQEFLDDDKADYEYLRKVACSHAEGWIEYVEGVCEAGGPPPCCPKTDHWHKDPNAWNIFQDKMRKVYNERYDILEQIYNNCQKEENYRIEQENKRKAEEQKQKEAEKKQEEEKRLAEEKKQKEAEKQQAEEQKKRQAEREAEQKRQAEAERKRIEEENNRKFEQRKSQAISDQRARDAETQRMSDQMNSLYLAWIALYRFEEPLNRYYNTRGMFFTFGPTTSLLFSPTFINTSDYSTYNTNYYQYGRISDYSSKVGTIFTIPLGLTSTFGYLSDAFHITFPMSASFGYIPYAHNSSYKYSVGTNIFLGLRSVEHLKLGFGLEYDYSNISKSHVWTYDGGDSYSEIYNMADASFGLKTMKFGIRYHNYLNTINVNSDEPFVVDLFFTLSHVRELNKLDKDNLNTYVHPVAPGFEFNINKYGKFGVFGKVAFIRPTGILDTYQSSSTTVDNYINSYGGEWHQTNNEATDFKLGERFMPYIEIGVKREYSWFKQFSTYGRSQSTPEPFSIKNFNLTMNYDFGTKNVFYGYSHKDSVKNFKFRTKDLAAFDETLKFKSISFDLQYNVFRKFSAGFLFRKYFYTKDENATSNHSATDFDLSLRTNFINYDKLKLYGNYIFGFNTSKASNATSLYKYKGLNGELALGASYYITRNIGFNLALGYSIHNYYMSKGVYKDKDVFTNQNYTYLNVINRKHINLGMVFKL